MLGSDGNLQGAVRLLRVEYNFIIEILLLELDALHAVVRQVISLYTDLRLAAVDPACHAEPTLPCAGAAACRARRYASWPGSHKQAVVPWYQSPMYTYERLSYFASAFDSRPSNGTLSRRRIYQHYQKSILEKGQFGTIQRSALRKLS